MNMYKTAVYWIRCLSLGRVVKTLALDRTYMNRTQAIQPLAIHSFMWLVLYLTLPTSGMVVFEKYDVYTTGHYFFMWCAISCGTLYWLMCVKATHQALTRYIKEKRILLTTRRYQNTVK